MVRIKTNTKRFRSSSMILIHPDLWGKLLRARKSMRASWIGLLGEKQGIVTYCERLKTTPECSWMPNVSTNSFTTALVKFAKKGIRATGIARLTQTDSEDALSEYYIGNAMRTVRDLGTDFYMLSLCQDSTVACMGIEGDIEEISFAVLKKVMQGKKVTYVMPDR